MRGRRVTDVWRMQHGMCYRMRLVARGTTEIRGAREKARIGYMSSEFRPSTKGVKVIYTASCLSRTSSVTSGSKENCGDFY